MTDYSNHTREQLIQRIRELENLTEAYRDEKEKEELLNFSWTGNLGHWYWDVPTNTVEFNPLKVMTLGYSRDEIPEKTDYQFFTDKLHPDDYDRVMNNMMEHLDGKRNVYEVEYRIKTKQGDWKYFYDRGKITKRDENGRPLFLAGIVFDITREKEAEAQLEEKSRSLEQEVQTRDKFFSIISHDLKKAFQHLIGFPEVLLANFDDYSSEKIKEMISTIGKEADTTYSLLENLFDWAQLKRGAIDFQPERLDLGKLVDQSFHWLDSTATAKDVRLINHVHDIYVTGDSNMLLTVFRNLLHNALKFSFPGQKVEISAYRKQDHIVISVSDEGTGMPESIRKDLFRIEKNVSRTGTDKEKGTGLGLILCKEFVEEHGGSIWVESSIHKGTRFYFSVPGE